MSVISPVYSRSVKLLLPLVQKRKDFTSIGASAIIMKRLLHNNRCFHHHNQQQQSVLKINNLSNSRTLNRNSHHHQLQHNHLFNQHYRLKRTFSTAPVLQNSAEMIDITFITNDGKELKTKGKIGDNLLDVVINNQIDLDGFGACEGTLACSTCHLVFKKPDFDKITDKITDEELDMLDLAYGLQDTSRLGCQVTLTKELDGLVVEVPAGVNDQRG